VTFTQEGQTFSRARLQAVPSYDMASGLGTVDAANVVHENSGTTRGYAPPGGRYSATALTSGLARHELYLVSAPLSSGTTLAGCQRAWTLGWSRQAGMVAM
jgi:hypothetical protein